ncbi:gluconate 2-dehydrogenase subunit 3 family protein [Xylophilus sp. GOD-11R]|uniref:gluconate 2-dehydrogenase subunit 3 family protein n=1 Tax=Xylophilus sp. GOD-11R TaxID=3089814 RepID=UPI00298D563A|nr:gluconate 2-dehydrogenase subunit 3 family protein [Xylophilus sp. GOD-11R]WPB58748.1 gluconate 2-dehydrogenase subunit 3 family protein [Xylophilus sp. GOD-11R]
MSHDSARRGFLRRSIAIVPATAVAAGCSPTPPPAASAQPTASAGNATPAAYTPRYFHPPEWAFVQAAVARLIPADAEGPSGIEAGVHEFIDRQMDEVFGHAAIWYTQGPFADAPPEFGYQGRLPPRDVYRAGIAACDAHCRQAFDGKTFAQLEPARQDEVLAGMETGAIVFTDVDSKTFFGFLLQNTKEGYLADPIHGGNRNGVAWQMIGFPGARADFADWVGRPGVQYPLPPVTIAGPQA